MNKESKLFLLLFIGLLSSVLIGSVILRNRSPKLNTQKELTATVMAFSENTVTVKDENDVVYTFGILKQDNIEVGSTIKLSYEGNFIDGVIASSYEVIPVESTPNTGLFKDYYKLAQEKLDTLSLDQKIGQLFLARYEDVTSETLKTYPVSGFIFYQKDFTDKTKEDVLKRSNDLQKLSTIPLLLGVDEEGGDVVRISSNPLLRKTPFKSPQELYEEGGFPLIQQDTIEKNKLLKELGLNLNLAPVVDVSTDPGDYIYKRTIGLGTKDTETYAETVIKASKMSSISYTLKHFPGYGNNQDTHEGSSTDERDYEEIIARDIPPFKAGINAGAEAVLVSHNIVKSIDGDNPASLSKKVHDLLQDELDFTGVTITDDLAMSALDEIEDKEIKAILAGNDLLITSNYKQSFTNIKEAINNKEITTSQLDSHVLKVLAWKYYKGLLLINQK